MKHCNANQAFRRRPMEVMNYLAHDSREELLRDIRLGLTQPQKSTPSKYFYDAHGSRLFDRICRTPEYYLTETELSILENSAAEIMTFFAHGGGDLIELGNGSTRKIKKLLDTLKARKTDRIRYVPVDISESALLQAAHEVSQRYESIDVLGIVADFTRHLEMLPKNRKMILFFGSTIGNFTDHECLAFLARVASIMKPDDLFVLGMDMLKSADVLEAAYNDKEGITRAFNLNLLRVLNRELDADFNLEDFEHLAFFNREEDCVEMHLRARRPVSVSIRDLGLVVHLDRGETIHTERCRKFSRESAERIFHKAGLFASRWLADPKGWFSLVELKTV